MKVCWCGKAITQGHHHESDVNTLEEFWRRIEPEPMSGCWLWLGTIDHLGYGHFSLAGKQWLAHRLSFEVARGPIPVGLSIDHKCRQRSCVNPSHLEAVPLAVNIRRGFNATKTTCRFGHPLDEFTKGKKRKPSRQCSICRKRHSREWARKAASARRSGYPASAVSAAP